VRSLCVEMSILITCVTRRMASSTHYDGVSGIGGQIDGVQWWRSEDDAIRDILAERSSYHVSERRKKVRVVVGNGAGRKYLKTASERVLTDELLGLIACSSEATDLKNSTDGSAR